MVLDLTVTSLTAKPPCAVAVGHRGDRAAAHAVTSVVEANPPFQSYHGKRDRPVPPNQAVLFNQAIRDGKGAGSDYRRRQRHQQQHVHQYSTGIVPQ
jgi:hypothetical protein